MTADQCVHADKVCNLVDRFQQWKGYECPYCEIERLNSILRDFHNLDDLEEIRKLRAALKTVRWRTAVLIDDARWTVGTERWRTGQDAKVTIHAIDEALGSSDDVGAPK